MSLFFLDRRAATPTSRPHDGENNHVVSGVEVLINVEMNLSKLSVTLFMASSKASAPTWVPVSIASLGLVHTMAGCSSPDTEKEPSRSHEAYKRRTIPT
jgi:hypothetical protein